MVITFLNGTARQHALFNRAMAVSLFPWDRIQTQVEVEWRDEVVLNGDHKLFASATEQAGLDGCGRSAKSKILIRNDLDDPKRPGNEGDFPKGYFRGEKFYMESVHHELGHVVASKLNPAQRAAICRAFGRPASEWDNPHTPWNKKVSESNAETLKDVFLPRAFRKFNNRTAWKITAATYEAWIGVYDDICPCSTARCFESGVTYWEYHKPAGVTWDLSWIPLEGDTQHLIGPAFTADRFLALIAGDERWLRIRFGGTGVDESGSYYQIPLPNPHFIAGPGDTSELLYYSIDFFVFPSENKIGYRLNEWGGDEHWWYDEDEQNMEALPVVTYGVWKQIAPIDESAPITMDLVSKTFETPIMPWWFIASLRICTGDATS